jgi:hypothetical protein
MALANPLLIQRLMARRACAWDLRRPRRFQWQNISGGGLVVMGVLLPCPLFSGVLPESPTLARSGVFTRCPAARHRKSSVSHPLKNQVA